VPPLHNTFVTVDEAASAAGAVIVAVVEAGLTALQSLSVTVTV
jgi:hypothetical protein